MAGRSKYTDEDRARVNVELTVSGGNVKRTARNTGLPIATVRDWKKAWERDGVPESVEVIAQRDVEQFVHDAREARSLALDGLMTAIPMAAAKGQARDLATIVGIMTDKIHLATNRPTQITESSNQPTPMQIQSMFAGLIKGALDATREREADIIEAEVVVEQLPKQTPAPGH